MLVIQTFTQIMFLLSLFCSLFRFFGGRFGDLLRQRGQAQEQNVSLVGLTGAEVQISPVEPIQDSQHAKIIHKPTETMLFFVKLPLRTIYAYSMNFKFSQVGFTWKSWEKKLRSLREILTDEPRMNRSKPTEKVLI